MRDLIIPSLHPAEGRISGIEGYAGSNDVVKRSKAVHAQGHSFKGEAMACVNGRCQATWATHQEAMTLCYADRYQRSKQAKKEEGDE